MVVPGGTYLARDGQMRAAMDGLLAGGPEGVKALQEFVSKNPRNRISSLASSELRIRGVQP